MDIYDAMESLSDTAVKLGIFVGNNRNKLNKVNTYETPLPDEDDILEELSDQGWGSEFKYARLRWRDGKGVQVKSLSMTSSRHEDTEKGDYFNGALSVLREMNEKLLEDNRRNAKLQQERERFMLELLKEREEVNRMLREERRQVEEDVLTEKATSVSMDIELQNALREKKGSQYEPFAQVALQLGQAWMSKMNVPPVTPDQILSQLKENPTLLDNFLHNPTLCNFLNERMAAIHGSAEPDRMVAIEENIFKSTEGGKEQ